MLLFSVSIELLRAHSAHDERDVILAVLSKTFKREILLIVFAPFKGDSFKVFFDALNLFSVG
jgi:hypothetical protein